MISQSSESNALILGVFFLLAIGACVSYAAYHNSRTANTAVLINKNVPATDTSINRVLLVSAVLIALVGGISIIVLISNKNKKEGPAEATDMQLSDDLCFALIDYERIRLFGTNTEEKGEKFYERGKSAQQLAENSKKRILKLISGTVQGFKHKGSPFDRKFEDYARAVLDEELKAMEVIAPGSVLIPAKNLDKRRVSLVKKARVQTIIKVVEQLTDKVLEVEWNRLAHIFRCRKKAEKRKDLGLISSWQLRDVPWIRSKKFFDIKYQLESWFYKAKQVKRLREKTAGIALRKLEFTSRFFSELAKNRRSSNAQAQNLVLSFIGPMSKEKLLVETKRVRDKAKAEEIVLTEQLCRREDIVKRQRYKLLRRKIEAVQAIYRAAIVFPFKHF